MALIKCPECGKEISEYSSFCIGCGCPMKKIKELSRKAKKPKKKKENSPIPKPDFIDAISTEDFKYITEFEVKF